MASLVQGLDWKTPLKSVKAGDHWRILLSAFLFAVPGSMMWHGFFPHVMPFLKLWAGLTTGSAVGALVGACWQFRDRTRLRLTSGKLLLMVLGGWGACAAFSLVVLAPHMGVEEAVRAELRSLTAENVLSIEVDDGESRTMLTDRGVIESFCNIASQADLFYPSHELSVAEYEVSLLLRDMAVRTFSACIPERHRDDLSLGFMGPVLGGELLLPGGRKWLESALAEGAISRKSGAVVQQHSP